MDELKYEGWLQAIGTTNIDKGKEAYHTSADAWEDFEDEMDDFHIHLQEVENIKQLCKEGVNYKIDSHILKRFNKHYKRYNLKLQWTTAN